MCNKSSKTPWIPYGLGLYVVQRCAKLIFIEEKFNSQEYIKTLGNWLLTHMTCFFSTFIFQRNLVPPHTWKSTKSLLNNSDLDIMSWPLNSPNLNPIDNVWRIIKSVTRSVSKLKGTKEGLKSCIMVIWKKYKVETCQKLKFSIPKRCRNVLLMKEYPTKYWNICIYTTFLVFLKKFLNYETPIFWIVRFKLISFVQM